MIGNYIDTTCDLSERVKSGGKDVVKLIDGSEGAHLPQRFAQLFERHFSLPETYHRLQDAAEGEEFFDSNLAEHERRQAALKSLLAGPQTLLKSSFSFSEWNSDLGDIEYWQAWFGVLENFTVRVNGKDCVLVHEILRSTHSDARGDVRYTLGSLYAVKKDVARDTYDRD